MISPHHDPLDDVVLTLTEFAKQLTESRQTVERWFRDGRCGFKGRGGRYRITRNEAEIVARFRKQALDDGLPATPSNVVPISPSPEPSPERHRFARPDVMERQIFELEEEVNELGDENADLRAQLRAARSEIRRYEREQ